MRDDDAVGGEMRRPHRAHRDPFALDPDTAERLLAGRLDPDDAPPGYAPVAALLARAASDQPATKERAGRAAALAAFAAVRTQSPHPSIPQRWSVLTKLFTLKVVAATVIGVLAAGGVAAATGNLPTSAQRVVDSHRGMGLGAAAHTSPSTADHGKGQGAGGQGQAGHATDSKGQASGQGPTLPGPAAKGLCQAWSDGQGAANGKKMDATAFQALVKAAGGEAKIASFCAKVMASATTTHGQAQPTGTGSANAGGSANSSANSSGSGNGNN
jgi:hypothetical protein